MTEFEITLNGKPLGTATVEKQGLYYRISCRCLLPDRKIHTIWVRWSDGSRKLGVCVPEGQYFCLDTKVPTKYFPLTGLSLEIDYQAENEFFPIDTQKPFIHIDKLEQSRFDIRDDQPGLVIPK